MLRNRAIQYVPVDWFVQVGHHARDPLMSGVTPKGEEPALWDCSHGIVPRNPPMLIERRMIAVGDFPGECTAGHRRSNAAHRIQQVA